MHSDAKNFLSKTHHLILLSMIILFFSATFNPLLACSLCADSITLSYFPGLDLLYSILLIYILGRSISSFVGTRKTSWKSNGFVFLLFIVLTVNYGNLNALMILTIYFFIKHTWQLIKFERLFQIGERIDLTLLIILVMALCAAYGIGKDREKDHQWLLSHIGMRASSELYYQKLSHFPQLPSVCSYIKEVASNSYIQEVKVGWLSRLASEKKLCKEELVYIYTNQKSQYLSAVYIPLIFMSNQNDQVWIELCKDQSFFDHSYDNKEWVIHLDEARDKMKHNCPSFK
jgi:hypothetical protein